ncbi:MAG: hypothetical protein M5U12_25845 [Verrucomicrobia bacterium]|nr:hypothetical protein [Verrucomicrobiota bacterium]
MPLAAATLRRVGFPREVAPNGGWPLIYSYDDLDATAPFHVLRGDYTRYGEVTGLLAEFDDRYVIMGPGDEIALRLPATALPPLGPDEVRSFVLVSHAYCKDMDLYTTTPQTLEPLPFRAMTRYPYPAGEQYPDTPEHRSYRAEYNTRGSEGARAFTGAPAGRCRPAHAARECTCSTGRFGRASIGRTQSQKVTDLAANLASPREAHATTATEQLRGRDGVENRAITEGLPVHAIRPIEQNFVGVRRSALPLAGAIEHVDQRTSRTAVRVGNEHNGMLPFVGEVKTPDVELVPHSGTSRLQPFSSASSSSAFAGVRYFFKLPRGNASTDGSLTSRLRTIRPSAHRS